MRHLLKYLTPVLMGAFVLIGPAHAETEPYTPLIGQDGKDVIWVPTDRKMVEVMLDMANIKPGDRLVDLGSGDGRTVVTAAQRGIAARGIEYNPKLVELAQRTAREHGVEEQALFEQGDIFETDFSDATVVTLFLLPSLNMRLRPTLLDMSPGTRVISNSFDMEDWKPDETRKVADDCLGRCDVHKWIVPAKVGGTWTLGDQELVLNQTFQKLDGMLNQGSRSQALTDAQLSGRNIQFTVDGKRYDGVVDNDQMRGKIDGQHEWSARRAASSTETG